MNKIRYKKLYNVASQIDKSNTHKQKVIKLLDGFSPEYIGKGKYKRCFKVKSNKRELVFKVGTIKNDMSHYKLSKGSRKAKYAKIYWETDNCLLQKLCHKGQYSTDDKKDLQTAWKKKGFVDVRDANVGKIGNRLVAFDVLESRRKR